MKKEYVKPELRLQRVDTLVILSGSQGNDDTTNDSSQGEDKDGDGVYGPGDAESKGGVWDGFDTWGNVWDE